MNRELVKELAKKVLSKKRIDKTDLKWFEGQLKQCGNVDKEWFNKSILDETAEISNTKSWVTDLNKNVPFIKYNSRSRKKVNKLTDREIHTIRISYIDRSMNQEELMKEYKINYKILNEVLFPEDNP